MSECYWGECVEFVSCPVRDVVGKLSIDGCVSLGSTPILWGSPKDRSVHSVPKKFRSVDFTDTLRELTAPKLQGDPRKTQRLQKLITFFLFLGGSSFLCRKWKSWRNPLQPEETPKGWRRISLCGRSDDACDFRIRSDFCPYPFTRCAVGEASKSCCFHRAVSQEPIQIVQYGMRRVNPWLRLKDRGSPSSLLRLFPCFKRIFSDLSPKVLSCPELSFCSKTNRREVISFRKLRVFRGSSYSYNCRPRMITFFMYLNSSGFNSIISCKSSALFVLLLGSSELHHEPPRRGSPKE